jgi:hypothetical protein
VVVDRDVLRRVWVEPDHLARLFGLVRRHPSQVLPSAPGVWSPVTGLESTATLERLEEHTVKLEWALS